MLKLLFKTPFNISKTKKYYILYVANSEIYINVFQLHIILHTITKTLLLVV